MHFSFKLTLALGSITIFTEFCKLHVLKFHNFHFLEKWWKLALKKKEGCKS